MLDDDDRQMEHSPVEHDTNDEGPISSDEIDGSGGEEHEEEAIHGVIEPV
jgi:hypothetical protein